MAWYSDAWTYRVKFTIASSQVDADLTDFPVYLDLSQLPSDFFTNVQSDGGDIRITTSGGTTELPREIVTIDTVGETGEVHFKVSGTLSSSSDTDFYIYYGNAAASDYAVTATYGAQNVWNSNYVGVWHFEEDPSGTAPQMLDSTSNNNDGTSYGSMTSGDSVAGKLGGNALDFDGSNDAISVDHTSALELTGSYTYSGWTKTTTTTTTSLMTNTPSGAPTNGWGINMQASSNVYRLLGYNGGLYMAIDSTTDPTDGSWHMFHAVQNGSTRADLYVAGSSEGNDTTISNVGSLTNEITLGGREQGTVNAYAGTFDEVRILSTNLASTWISTEYNNQNAPGTFVTASTQETITTVDWYDTAWSKRIKIGINSDQVPGDLTNFPVYVDLSDLDSTFFDDVKSDGGDIRVTKADGTTEVAREVVAIDTVSDTGQLHFQANGTLSSAQGTTFYIYYGNSGASEPAASATYGSENVWDSNFLGVWHLEEDPSGSSPQLLDSTSNSLDLTTAGSMTSGDLVAAQIENGIDFDGSNDDAVSSSNTGISGTASRTVSCWAKLTATPVDADPVTGSGATGGGNMFNLVTGVGGNGYWSIRTGTSGGSGNDLSSTTSSSSDVGSFVYLAGKYNGTTLKLRRNNAEIATGSRTLTTSDGLFRLAEGPQTTRNPPVVIDEVRLSDSHRSDDWNDAEYNNQNSASTFYSLGSPEDAPVSAENAIFFGCNF